MQRSNEIKNNGKFKRRLSLDIPARHIVIAFSSAELQILNEDAHEAKSISAAKEAAM